MFIYVLLTIKFNVYEKLKIPMKILITHAIIFKYLKQIFTVLKVSPDQIMTS